MSQNFNEFFWLKLFIMMICISRNQVWIKNENITKNWTHRIDFLAPILWEVVFVQLFQERLQTMKSAQKYSLVRKDSFYCPNFSSILINYEYGILEVRSQPLKKFLDAGNVLPVKDTVSHRLPNTIVVRYQKSEQRETMCVDLEIKDKPKNNK